MARLDTAGETGQLVKLVLEIEANRNRVKISNLVLHIDSAIATAVHYLSEKDAAERGCPKRRAFPSS
jgi:hypothetical protein